ncbi:PREDICTED: auxin-responsive protein SAUR36-like [Nicotiana attenuata]|uniref:Auxin-induced protein x15 n=1 Tax=Nicotiana attenuata TaxID=49451 RepID=A0A314KXA1_NICAT|nr:PREDICTED: auxin-responsive protein SAUR36-like [Nicotiana attenuata]OIT33775.1 auxin-induced protein x15 [Nicotiana attenuata]
MSGCRKICHIVKLCQRLRRLRKKATMFIRRVPSDVPAGHVAVTVGTNCKRYVVRTTYLNHPVFKKLLSQAEEEYGFKNSGPLAITCDETSFEELLCYLARTDSKNNNNKKNMSMFLRFEDFQRYCHVGIRSNFDIWSDSRPLLHGTCNNSVTIG